MAHGTSCWAFIIIMMSSNSKFGLRNAGELLKVLRRKYAKEAEESTLLQNKTFVEEESLELYENAGREESRILSQDRCKSKEEPPLEALSEIRPPPDPPASFCDRIITRNLHQTLVLYQQDLEILTENKALLEEKIEFMGEKIRKLKELEGSNRLLAAENDQARQFLAELVREYHESLHLVFRSQLQQQEAFNSLRSKVRIVLKELGEDYHYIGFLEHWNAHLETLQRHRALIGNRVAQERRTEAERARAEPEKPVKIVAAPRAGRGEEEDFLAPDEPKPKKRMSESEKASLLGDLKSFAKNFKFPS